ncbi:MAG TPA: hypothetical protein VGJ66_22740 [Pyrinomonadaceae bacterium]
MKRKHLKDSSIANTAICRSRAQIELNRLIRRMIPPIRRIPARMLVVNDEIGNIDKVTDQLPGGMDIEGWAALPWKHEVPDASFFGALNEDGSVPT